MSARVNKCIGNGNQYDLVRCIPSAAPNTALQATPVNVAKIHLNLGLPG